MATVAVGLGQFQSFLFCGLGIGFHYHLMEGGVSGCQVLLWVRDGVM